MRFKWAMIRMLSAAAACAAVLSGCAAIAALWSMGEEGNAELFVVPSDKSIVYVYRGEDLVDTVIAPVGVDGEDIREIRQNSHLAWVVEPGWHTIAVYAGNAANIALRTQAGQTYFVEQELDCGLSGLHVNLLQVDAVTGKQAVRASPLANHLPADDGARGASYYC